MEIREYDARDGDLLPRVVDLGNAMRAADSPWSHPETLELLTHGLAHGWDGQPSRAFALLVEGCLVASGNLGTSSYDNLDFADFGVGVHPAHRRRGYGAALLSHLEDEARRLGRTKVGVGGWADPVADAFAASRGYSPAISNVQRRQDLRSLDWARVEGLHEGARARAGDYELVRRVGPTPPEELPALAEMTAAINDAPLEDLDLEDEVFPPERVAVYEDTQLRIGRLYRVLARHRESGELAGHTVVVVERSRPWIGGQHDTSVVRAHRGHRLGLLLKAEMLRWLREAEPQLATVDTWNARSNDHMIGVNEALGYEVVGQSVFYQRAL